MNYVTAKKVKYVVITVVKIPTEQLKKMYLQTYFIRKESARAFALTADNFHIWELYMKCFRTLLKTRGCFLFRATSMTPSFPAYQLFALNICGTLTSISMENMLKFEEI
jgi:hypothetical protein